MPAEGLALFMAGSQVYEVTSTDRSQDVQIFSTYVDRDILQSGWLLGEQVIAAKRRRSRSSTATARSC